MKYNPKEQDLWKSKMMQRAGISAALPNRRGKQVFDGQRRKAQDFGGAG